MTDTTRANDIFNSQVGELIRIERDWSHATSITTCGEPSIISKKTTGIVTTFREKVQSAVFCASNIMLQNLKTGSRHESVCLDS